MNQGRIIVITGSPGTGKTTTASIVAKESDMDKSVHMHTDDFFHYLSGLLFCNETPSRTSCSTASVGMSSGNDPRFFML